MVKNPTEPAEPPTAYEFTKPEDQPFRVDRTKTKTTERVREIIKEIQEQGGPLELPAIVKRLGEYWVGVDFSTDSIKQTIYKEIKAAGTKPKGKRGRPPKNTTATPNGKPSAESDTPNNNASRNSKIVWAFRVLGGPDFATNDQILAKLKSQFPKDAPPDKPVINNVRSNLKKAGGATPTPGKPGRPKGSKNTNPKPVEHHPNDKINWAFNKLGSGATNDDILAELLKQYPGETLPSPDRIALVRSGLKPTPESLDKKIEWLIGRYVGDFSISNIVTDFTAAYPGETPPGAEQIVAVKSRLKPTPASPPPTTAPTIHMQADGSIGTVDVAGVVKEVKNLGNQIGWEQLAKLVDELKK